MKSRGPINNKHIIITLLALFFVVGTRGQTYYNVSHFTGTQAIGGRNVTVNLVGTGHGTNNNCGASPYLLGNNVSTSSGYLFTFNLPVNRIRLKLAAIHPLEEISFFINGAFYPISTSQLSVYIPPPSPCSTHDLAIQSLGKIICPPASIAAMAVVDIQFHVDSIRIMHNGFGACAMEFNFAADTQVFIRQPFIDTVVCAGDSLHLNYGVYNKFNSTNNFTAQLSDAIGSFASPATIGTRASDSAGVIACKIPASATGGNNYRIRIVSSSPIRTSDTIIAIRIKPLPAAFSANSNTPVCSTDSLILLGASSSSNVVYSWTGPQGFTSAAKDTGVGHVAMTAAGNYILTATLDGCILKDTETVLVKPIPNKPTASNNGPLCTGDNLALNITGGGTGVSYSWAGPGGYTSNLASATRNSVIASWSGDYIGSATLNGCSVKDTTTVVIHPVPATPSALSNSPVCAGGELQLSASAVPGAVYEWSGPGLFSSTLQNAKRQNIQITDGGTYTVVAKVNNCPSAPGNTVVVVNNGPEVLIYPNPGDTICPGWDVTFAAVPKNAGGTPTYAWYRNGVNTGGTAQTYKASGVNDKDSFYVLMTAGSACNTPISSKPIKITVLPVHTPPTISINANPGDHVWPGVQVTFTATPGNAGTHPGYQWRRNWKDISKANDPTWSAAYLQTGDTICCVVTSNFLCAVPREVLSNCIVMNVDLGIEEQGVRNKVKVYPNPASDKLIVEGVAMGTKLQIFDIVGKEVYRGLAAAASTEIDVRGLGKGNYILQLTGADGEKVYRKFVKE